MGGHRGLLTGDIEARSRMSAGLDIPEALSCHDHSIRIARRLTVHADAGPKFEILAAAILGIASTVARYQPFANPKASVGLPIGDFLNFKCVVILTCKLCIV